MQPHRDKQALLSTTLFYIVIRIRRDSRTLEEVCYFMEIGEELQVQSARFPLLRFRRSSSFQSAKKERKKEGEPRSLFSFKCARGRSVRSPIGLGKGERKEGDEIRARRTSYILVVVARAQRSVFKEASRTAM